MGLAAKRFSFLDDETNVAVSNFTDPKTSDIFNSPNLELKNMDADMSNFLKQGVSSGALALNSVKDTVDGSLRKAKDAFSSLKDIGSLSQKQIDSYVTGMFPDNPAVASLYKGLASSCRTGPMSRYNAGKPFDTNVDCNGNKRKTSGGCTNGMSNILNKLSGGQYASQYNNLSRSLSNLVALATTGYNANMCGVFGALSGGLDPKVLSRGAGMLLGSLGSSKNLMGVLDLSKNIGNFTGMITGSSVMKEIPNGISNVFNNFKMPGGVKQTAFTELNESINLGIGSFDSSWKSSKFDSITSCSFLDKPSVDYNNILRGDAMNFSVNEDSLDLIPSSTTNLMRSGMVAKSSSVQLAYLREFTTIN